MSELARGLEGVKELLTENAAEQLEEPAEAETADEGQPVGAGGDDDATAHRQPNPPDGEPDLDLGIAGDDDGEQPATEPVAAETLDQLAEIAGVDVASLYELRIGMPDEAEPMTLGAMKDLAIAATDIDRQGAEIEERRSAFENEMIRARQELHEVIALLPQIPPALIERARQATEEHVERERQALLTIKPEWRDDSVYQGARDSILEAVSDYGFTRADLDLVVDHRLTKLLHDFAQMRARIESATRRHTEVLNQATKAKRPNQAAESRKRDAAQKAKAKAGSTAEKVSAVAGILKDG